MIKLFEDFNNHQEVITLCEKYGIENYTINEDLSIDVDGSVDISDMKLIKIPIKFNKVTGTFSCRNNNISDLENSPRIVGQNFICDINVELTNLKGCPEFVLGDFSCMNSNLKDLGHLPKIIGRSLYLSHNKLTNVKIDEFIVGVDLHLSNNKLTSIEGIQPKVNGGLYLSYNKLKDLKHFPETILKAVLIDHNILTSLKGDLRNTHTLDVSSNKLKNLENDLHNIDYLSAGSNKITTLKGCPKNLEVLNVYGNQLTSLDGLKGVTINHIFIMNNNSISNLIGMPICNGYGISNNPLPQELLNIDQHPMLNKVIQNQEEYGIWNSDGSFNKARFDILLKELL